tara:strand:+ start:214 stop:441 length:228 start_codon:yes stop_codon:yes gene_type:complete
MVNQVTLRCGVLEAGDLVEIVLAEEPNKLGVYVSPDYNSAWVNGEEHRWARIMVLWEGTLCSVPIDAIEIMVEGK